MAKVYIYIYSNGDIYVGNFENGLFDGKGKLRFVKDSAGAGYYEGGFRNDLFHGYAKYGYDLVNMKGNFTNDKQDGIFNITYKNGINLIGQFTNGIPNGKFKYSNSKYNNKKNIGIVTINKSNIVNGPNKYTTISLDSDSLGTKIIHNSTQNDKIVYNIKLHGSGSKNGSIIYKDDNKSPLLKNDNSKSIKTIDLIKNIFIEYSNRKNKYNELKINISSCYQDISQKDLTEIIKNVPQNTNVVIEYAKNSLVDNNLSINNKPIPLDKDNTIKIKIYKNNTCQDYKKDIEKYGFKNMKNIEGKYYLQTKVLFSERIKKYFTNQI